MRRQKIYALSVALVLAQTAVAQNLPQGTVLPGDKLIPSGASQPPGQRAKALPGDQTIPSYEIGDPELKAAVDRARNAMEDLKKKQVGTGSNQPDLTEKPLSELPSTAVALPDPQIKPAESESPPEVLPKIKKHYRTHTSETLAAKTEQTPAYTDTKGGVRIFNQALRNSRGAGQDTYTLPSTSVALATTLYGIEATSNVERLVPAELNYAWLGPNGSVVEMRNCRLWIAVRGDYSTERVYGRSQSMSCRAPSGETFDIPIEAHMVDQQEEYLGARGTLVARGKALASALSFLSDGVKAFGSAMAAAQVNTEVTPSGGFGEPVKGSNVGGDKNKYIIGQTLSGTSSKFLDWWIDYYQSLSPTIAIGPGKKIYLAIQHTIQVPKIFFGERLSAGEINSMVASAKDESGEGSDESHKINTTHTLTTLRRDASRSGDDGEAKP